MVVTICLSLHVTSAYAQVARTTAKDSVAAKSADKKPHKPKAKKPAQHSDVSVKEATIDKVTVQENTAALVTPAPQEDEMMPGPAAAPEVKSVVAVPSTPAPATPVSPAPAVPAPVSVAQVPAAPATPALSLSSEPLPESGIAAASAADQDAPIIWDEPLGQVGPAQKATAEMVQLPAVGAENNTTAEAGKQTAKPAVEPKTQASPVKTAQKATPAQEAKPVANASAPPAVAAAAKPEPAKVEAAHAAPPSDNTISVVKAKEDLDKPDSKKPEKIALASTSTALPTAAAVSQLLSGASQDNSELIQSLMLKVRILETEKERFRKKLLDMNPGELKEVYQCAAENNRANELQNQVDNLTKENKELKESYKNVTAIPALPAAALPKLPPAK